MAGDLEVEVAPRRSVPSIIDRTEAAIDDRSGTVLGAIVASFVAIHVARISRVLINGDGTNYLSGAMRIADGDLPYPRYSPGLSFLLSPLAVVLDAQPRALFYVAAVLNLGLSVAALLLIRRFLAAYLSNAATLLLLAVFALGETATNVLVGTEVEPISLLLVTLVLVAMQSERLWIATVATGAAAMSRIALVPFFGILWLVRWRRSPRHSAIAIGLLGVDLVAYLALARQASYLGIARASYTEGGDGSRDLAAGALALARQHSVRYVRLGIPSALWPGQVLSTGPGQVLGVATTLCTVVGALVLVRRWSGRADDGVLRPAILGAGCYALLLWLWPANDGALLRLSMPLAPLVLLLTAVGARRLVASATSRSREVVGAALVGALGLGVAASVGLAVTRRTSEAPVADLVTVTRRAAETAPDGPLLSQIPALTQVISGRQVIAFEGNITLEQVMRLAERHGACAVILTEVRDPVDADLASSLRRSPAARKLVTVGNSSAFALDEPRCADEG